MGTYFRFDLLGQHEEKAARLEAVRQGPKQAGGPFQKLHGGEFGAGERRQAPDRPTTKIPEGASPPAQDSAAPSSLAVGSSWQTPSEHPSHLLLTGAEVTWGEVSQHPEHPHRPPGAVEGILTQPNPQAATGFRLLDEVQDDKDHSRGLGSHQAQVPHAGTGPLPQQDHCWGRTPPPLQACMERLSGAQSLPIEHKRTGLTTRLQMQKQARGGRCPASNPQKVAAQKLRELHAYPTLGRPAGHSRQIC